MGLRPASIAMARWLASHSNRMETALGSSHACGPWRQAVRGASDQRHAERGLRSDGGPAHGASERNRRATGHRAPTRRQERTLLARMGRDRTLTSGNRKIRVRLHRTPSILRRRLFARQGRDRLPSPTRRAVACSLGRMRPVTPSSRRRRPFPCRDDRGEPEHASCAKRWPPAFRPWPRKDP